MGSLPADSGRLRRALPLFDQAYDAVVERILDGRLPLGSRLVESALAADLGTSRTPVREAIRRLERDGLAVRTPTGGVAVFQPQPEDVRQIYESRIAIEGMAAFLAASRSTPAEREVITGTVATLAEAYAAGDEAGVVRANTAFHDALLAACGNRYLQTLAAHLRHHVLLTRALDRAQHGDSASVLGHHRAILAAITAGDGPRARQLTEEHIRSHADRSGAAAPAKRIQRGVSG
ncbi:MAG TPA: GntR family transcriptional regulator [Bacillota bacterium]|nr:GntR family transcriptional regulator [Bacillota bacterium]